MHRIDISDLGAGELHAGSRVVVPGEEARHATRVKRLGEGDRITLLDGRGLVALSRIEKIRKAREWELELVVERAERVARTMPRVEVYSAVPKGDRLSAMIESLSQVGAARWSPLRCARSVAESVRRERLERVARESMKQCGRAWVMEIGEEMNLPGVLGLDGVVIADASGAAPPRPGNLVRVVVGPEGGWSDQERGLFTGRVVARFAPHVMRIETAAALAAGMLVGSAT